jgi:hypothetical protein
LPSPPPFDEPTAASVALSIKTFLKLSSVAPAEERFGAEEAISGGTAVGERRWSFESGLGARHSLQDDDSGELRMALGVARRFDAGVETAVNLVTGPGREVLSERFDGHFNDTTVGLSARYWESHAGLEIGVGAAADLHLGSIRGTVDGGVQASASRLNPAVGADLWLRRPFAGTFELGLGAHSRYFLRRQRYLVGGESVLELPAADIQLDLQVSLPFY